jgi:MFS transporter, DHA1 family, inner membrane transport protein
LGTDFEIGSKFPKRSSYLLYIAALILAVFATYLLNMLVSIYLKDIAATFGVTQGVSSQIQTISSIVAVPVALVIGFLSLRYNHKYLILGGLIFILIGLAGVYLAPNFTVLRIFYPFDGIGSPVVGVIALVMMGESLPTDKQGKVVGWTFAIGTLSYLVGVFVGGAIVDIFGSWRSILTIFAIPITLLALVMAYLFIPARIAQQPPKNITRKYYFHKYRLILANKSALGCLSGTFLRIVLPITGSIFGVAFFRTYWHLPLNVGLLIFVLWITAGFFGAWIGGTILNRGGRKRLTVIMTFLEAVMVMSFVSVPAAWGTSWVWMAIGLSVFAPFFSGIGGTAVSCLYLGQVPESLGPLMSLRTVSIALGTAFGVAVGGFMLDAYGYQMIGVTLGLLGIIGALIFLFLTKDPTIGRDVACKNDQTTQLSI